MLRESVTIQRYPDDNVINETVALYEKFGWELASNQRCQEKDGDMITTFHKLTFQRDKEARWYKTVAQAQKDYETAIANAQALEAQAPKRNIGRGGKINYFIAFVLLCCGIFPGLIYIGFFLLKGGANKGIDAKVEKDYNAWVEANQAKLDEYYAAAEAALKAAEDAISG